MTRLSAKTLYFLTPLLLGTVASCVTVKRNAVPLNIQQISEPEIGVPVTVGVGEQMVRQGTVAEEKVLIVHEKAGGFTYTVPAGEYIHMGFDENNDFYEKGAVTKAALADSVSALSVKKGNTSTLYVVTVFGHPSPYEANFSEGTRLSKRHDSFQQTLIYSGRIGSKVNISYREFSNNTARPAFNNDVEYDLDASKVIGYKGARLEIIDANNSSITFKLISNFK
jgi:hypothetical protein